MSNGLTSKRNLLFVFLFCLVVGVVILVAACTQTPAPSSTPPAKPAASTAVSGTSGSNVPPQIATVAVSKPANGTYFAVGEQPAVTVTLSDSTGKPLSRSNDYSNLRLMAAGPIETLDTTTPVKLLKTTADRTQTIHHYVDLTTNPDVQVNNGVLTYKLAAVSDEKPGTYSVGVWAVLKADGLQQAMSVADIQIGTATVQNQIVTKDKCNQCHLGPDSGKIYLHHIDPSSFAPLGNWALDSLPVQDCKICHNNDGYAAYVSPTDSKVSVADPIVKRVHGVHMGEGLTNTVDTNPQNGLFKDYTSVVFPADVENCTYCHTDNRWKTQPSRLACGACHDNTWFGDFSAMPKGMKAHSGGTQNNDTTCGGCHPPDTGGAKSVTEAHKVSQPLNIVDIQLSAPGNGKFFTAGEKPVLTLVIRDDNGNPIDHTKIDETTFSTASFFVYGPRDTAAPVLTNAARNQNSRLRAAASSSIPAAGTTTKGWTFVDGDAFKIAVNGGPVQELKAPVGLQTPDQVRDWLKANMKEVTVTSSPAAGSVTITSNLQGANSRFDIYNSAVTAKMGWKPGPLDLSKEGVKYGRTPGTTVEPYVVIANATTNAVDMRPRIDPLNYTDPLVVRNPGSVTYQLDDVAGLKPGTYMAYSYVVPNGILAGTGAGPTGAPTAAAKPLNDSRTGIGFTTFQVGNATPDKKIATNCADCHAKTIWHLDEGPIHPQPFDTDYCLACHDYNRSGTGDLFSRVGGNSTSGWAGYGAKPISARVHGVHFGNYLDHPEWVYAGNPNAFNEIIFPQDVRNCEKCHDPKTAISAWKDQPSRLACSACHDSDAAISHMNLMVQNPIPSDPYNPNRVETCTVCHGPGKDFAVDKVHKINNPFVPPYPRGG